MIGPYIEPETDDKMGQAPHAGPTDFFSLTAAPPEPSALPEVGGRQRTDFASLQSGMSARPRVILNNTLADHAVKVNVPDGPLGVRATVSEAWERYDYLYSEEELKDWVPGLRKMEAMAGKAYVLFNNCHEGKAARNSLMMKALLGLEVEPQGRIELPGLEGSEMH